MARPLRIEYSGAFYHVMNRGSDRQVIFHESKHYQMFLDLLADSAEQYKLEVHAYCLMSNHYHLLIRTPYPNLSKIMRHINGVYTQRYNRLNKRDGALFKGRYKAILVEVDNYLLQLSRYIHLNPVSARMVQKPEDYSWSSYRFYIGAEKRPDWLYCDETLNQLTTKDRVTKYREFVCEKIEQAIGHELIVNCPILGTDEFIRKINSQHIKNTYNKEIPEYSSVLSRVSPTIEEVIHIVSEHFEVEESTIMMRKNKRTNDLPKMIAIYLALQLPNQNLIKIAKVFNEISISNASQINSWVKVELKNNAALLAQINQIRKKFEK